MICPFCKAEIADELSFCPECGAEVNANQPEEPATTAFEEPAEVVETAASSEKCENGKGVAIASLVCGIVSLVFSLICGLVFSFFGPFFCFIPSLAAIILGVVAKKKGYNATVMAKLGLVFGIVGLVLSILFAVGSFLFTVIMAVIANSSY